MKAQQKVVRPVLAASAQEQAAQRQLQIQRQMLQQQLTELPTPKPQAVSRAKTREAERCAPVQAPECPGTPGEWVALMRSQAQSISGQRLSSQQQTTFQAIQRKVTSVLVEQFRADRNEPLQRHALYGEHLAELYQDPLAQPVARATLGRLPRTEQPKVEQAMTGAIQRKRDETALDQAILRAAEVQGELDTLPRPGEVLTQGLYSRVYNHMSRGQPLAQWFIRLFKQVTGLDLSGVQVIQNDGTLGKIGAAAATMGTMVSLPNIRLSSLQDAYLAAHEFKHTGQYQSGQVQARPGEVDPQHYFLEPAAHQFGKRYAASLKAALEQHGLQDKNITEELSPRFAVSFTGPSRPPAIRQVQPTPDFASASPFAPSNPAANPAAKSILRNSISPDTQFNVPAPVADHGAGFVLQGTILYETPDFTGKHKKYLAAGTRVQITGQRVSAQGPSWRQVVIGQEVGYLPSTRLTTQLPDYQSQMIQVTPGMTAEGVAKKYYGSKIKNEADLEFYIYALEKMNRDFKTLAFKDDENRSNSWNLNPTSWGWVSHKGELVPGKLLWIPGEATTLRYKAERRDKGVLYAIRKSITESGKHFKAEFAEGWRYFKDSWLTITGGLLVFIAGGAGALALVSASPLLTFLVALIGIVLGVALPVVQFIKYFSDWLDTARDADGDPEQIKKASLSFAKMWIFILTNVLAFFLGLKLGQAMHYGLSKLFARLAAKNINAPESLKKMLDFLPKSKATEEKRANNPSETPDPQVDSQTKAPNQTDENASSPNPSETPDPQVDSSNPSIQTKAPHQTDENASSSSATQGDSPLPTKPAQEGQPIFSKAEYLKEVDQAMDELVRGFAESRDLASNNFELLIENLSLNYLSDSYIFTLKISERRLNTIMFRIFDSKNKITSDEVNIITTVLLNKLSPIDSTIAELQVVVNLKDFRRFLWSTPTEKWMPFTQSGGGKGWTPTPLFKTQNDAQPIQPWDKYAKRMTKEEMTETRGTGFWKWKENKAFPEANKEWVEAFGKSWKGQLDQPIKCILPGKPPKKITYMVNEDTYTSNVPLNRGKLPSLTITIIDAKEISFRDLIIAIIENKLILDPSDKKVIQIKRNGKTIGKAANNRPAHSDNPTPSSGSGSTGNPPNRAYHHEPSSNLQPWEKYSLSDDEMREIYGAGPMNRTFKLPDNRGEVNMNGVGPFRQDIKRTGDNGLGVLNQPLWGHNGQINGLYGNYAQAIKRDKTMWSIIEALLESFSDLADQRRFAQLTEHYINDFDIQFTAKQISLTDDTGKTHLHDILSVSIKGDKVTDYQHKLTDTVANILQCLQEKYYYWVEFLYSVGNDHYTEPMLLRNNRWSSPSGKPMSERDLRS